MLAGARGLGGFGCCNFGFRTCAFRLLAWGVLRAGGCAEHRRLPQLRVYGLKIYCPAGVAGLGLPAPPQMSLSTYTKERPADRE